MKNVLLPESRYEETDQIIIGLGFSGLSAAAQRNY